MAKIVIFWILLGGLGFAFALAVQMRVMIALVLRRALKAWRPEFEDRIKANAAVIAAAGEQPIPDDMAAEMMTAVEHLRVTYPNPLSHLRTARRYSVVTPVLLLAVLAMGRTILGVI
ncbi:MAG: hypothetical protein AAFQ15_03280 [Pseudomonadota bacterium]